jgi:hypothetical protein
MLRDTSRTPKHATLLHVAQDKIKENDEEKEKVVKTDKVLIGAKTSWSVAKAIGEVSQLIQSR